MPADFYLTSFHWGLAAGAFILAGVPIIIMVLKALRGDYDQY